MKFIKKYLWEVVLVGVIIIFFAVTRFYNILSLPIFTDEAIYIRWAQIANGDATWRFISLTDGKQPLFIWFIMIFLRFIDDPLLAGRAVSVVAGAISMIGLFFLTKELFRNYRTGLFAAALYAVYPFALVYDRMALYDSLTAAFFVWALYLQILLIRRVRFDIALLLGMVMGGGVLNKTIGFISVYLMPLALLLFEAKQKERRTRFFKWALFTLASIILTYMYYSILRLSPFFHIINEKNALFIYPLREWTTHPFQFLIGNLLGLWDWFLVYTTWPVIFLIAGSFIVGKSMFKEKVFLLLWFVLPFIALALFGKTLYPRFIFFMTLSLLPLAAFSLDKLIVLIKKPVFVLALLAVLFFLQMRSDYLIVSDFARAPIPYSDLNQYIKDWPAGVGVKEAVAFFKDKANSEKIYIATQGSFGLMPYALEIYLVDNANITIAGFWPVDETPPTEVVEANKKLSTYILFYQPCVSCKSVGEAPASWPVRLVAKYERPPDRGQLSIYQLNP